MRGEERLERVQKSGWGVIVGGVDTSNKDVPLSAECAGKFFLLFFVSNALYCLFFIWRRGEEKLAAKFEFGGEGKKNWRQNSNFEL